MPARVYSGGEAATRGGVLPIGDVGVTLATQLAILCSSPHCCAATLICWIQKGNEKRAKE